MDARTLREQILRGEATVLETVRSALADIDRRDGEVHAFLTVEKDYALERAAALDRELVELKAQGAVPPPLFGVPVAIKANLAWQGFETNCASRTLENWRAPYTATAVRRLVDAGAVPLGTTNMDEFAMGSSTENSCHGPTRNPRDLTRIPGGSSGGSAAAVAAGFVPLALGSDTGGSVRQPAALCGVAGFKPTYGRISRYGLVAFGSSLDQVSPIATNVGDLELALAILAGVDERDATCLREPAPRPQSVGLAGLRLGVLEMAPNSLEAGVEAAYNAAAAALEAAGAVLKPIALPHGDLAIPTYYVLATAEASSNLARYDGVRYGLRAKQYRDQAPAGGSLQEMFAATRRAAFGAEVKRRILLGTFVLSHGYQDAWYGRASRARRLLAQDYAAAFEQVDAIISPTSPCVAFPLGARTADPLSMYLADTLTVPASLAGLPAVSVPCHALAEERNGSGQDRQAELPVGLQFVGPAGEDARLLAMARAFEELAP
ncbi:MAG: Asp-tRNA(Asn)/Glu-tRNA(Gln) amidotransferase GatCAB subunit A [Planctomycetes bacterium]|jgi:aspartyl-tRNA(Asn)/glutamyl-tRNA(Gln) amidotransferase subunit A|nr:Asp-tRNA(Asn)/Glu-tRNA(Gln) amidotransferase GatCAB subunit A [Planctomycetota bacterium]